MRCYLQLVAVVLLCSSPSAAQLPSFSLDDFPVSPLTSTPGFIPGRGAEDPFGLGTFGPQPGAPSPSLASVPAMDGDLITVGAGGLQIDVAMSPFSGNLFSYIDAVSTNTFVGATARSVHMIFSVDRVTRGSPGSDVAGQVALNQAPGDVYHSVANFTHPVSFTGTVITNPGGFNGPLPTAGAGPGSNILLADESLLGMTVTGVPGVGTPLGTLAPPIGPGTHDNLDALEAADFDLNGDTITDRPLYFSTGPDDQTGIPGSFIFQVPAGAPPTAVNLSLFSTPTQVGLTPLRDDIDGLVVWEAPGGTPRVADPGSDFALFSLAHGSRSLAGLSEADIFFTDFRGGFWLFANAASLGLGGFNDNIDALDIVIPGDANLDGVVDGLDLTALLPNLFTAAPPQLGWLLGDFDGSRFIDPIDFLIWNSNQFTSQRPAVPEPSSGCLLPLSLVAFHWRQRVC